MLSNKREEKKKTSIKTAKEAMKIKSHSLNKKYI
jgi:hypothetical protein